MPIVRTSSRFAGVGPLLPVRAWTVEGRERFGGVRPTGGAGVWGGGRNPGLLLGTNLVALHRNRRGLRALPSFARGLRGLGVVNYCDNNPPSAEQVAYLNANNIQYAIVPCGGIPTPQGTNLGNQPISTAPIYTTQTIGAAPVYQAPTGIEDCAALGLATAAGQACVARNTQRAIDAENAHLAANANYQTQLCIANAGGGWVPAGDDLATWCSRQYGGAIPSGYTPTPAQPYTGLPVSSGGGLAPSAPAVSVNPGRLAFANVTTGDASRFKVGDQFRLSISGASPNQPVSVTYSQDGKGGTSVMGSTDTAGNWSTSGTMDSSAVGQWTETWKVGGVVAGQLAFPVAQAASGGGAAAQSGGSVQQQQQTGGGAAPSATFDLAAWLQDSMFMGIPNWGLLAGGAAALLIVPRLVK